MYGPNDQKILDFLEKYGVATTSTIKEYIGYKSMRSAQMRLKKLSEKYKVIKKRRDIQTNEYMFFIEEPKQLRHKLILTNFYREMLKRYEILAFDREVSVGRIRADGIVVYMDNGKMKNALIEVQICHTKLDIEKYQELLYSGKYKDVFGNNPFPNLIAITNQRLPEVKEFKINQIKVDLNNLDEVLGGNNG